MTYHQTFRTQISVIDKPGNMTWTKAWDAIQNALQAHAQTIELYCKNGFEAYDNGGRRLIPASAITEIDGPFLVRDTGRFDPTTAETTGRYTDRYHFIQTTFTFEL